MARWVGEWWKMGSIHQYLSNRIAAVAPNRWGRRSSLDAFWMKVVAEKIMRWISSASSCGLRSWMFSSCSGEARGWERRDIGKERR